jgi:hypothetical protein
MRKLLMVPMLAAAALVSVTAVSFTGTAQATPPKLTVRVYDARDGGYGQIGFWMRHSKGWNWSGTGSGAKRLGCSIIGTYSGGPNFNGPFSTLAFSGTVKPSGNPYLTWVSIGPNWVQNAITINSTCTLRHLTVKHVWLYKTVKSSWDGT